MLAYSLKRKIRFFRLFQMKKVHMNCKTLKKPISCAIVSAGHIMSSKANRLKHIKLYFFSARYKMKTCKFSITNLQEKSDNNLSCWNVENYDKLCFYTWITDCMFLIYIAIYIAEKKIWNVSFFQYRADLVLHLKCQAFCWSLNISTMLI